MKARSADDTTGQALMFWLVWVPVGIMICLFAILRRGAILFKRHLSDILRTN